MMNQYLFFLCAWCFSWTLLLTPIDALAVDSVTATSADEIVYFEESTAARSLKAQPTQFDDTLLDVWGVPRGAHLLIQSKTSCGSPPPTTAASNLALLCNTLRETRKCMGIGDKVVWMTARECKGEACMLKLSEIGSKCFFDAYGLDIDIKNASRKETCGLRPEDADMLAPFPNINQAPVGMNDNCITAVPSHVLSHYVIECKDGKPLLRLELLFDKQIVNDKFDCLLSPICYQDIGYRSKLLCYAESRGHLDLSGEESSFEHGMGLACLTSILYALGITFFGISILPVGWWQF